MEKSKPIYILSPLHGGKYNRCVKLQEVQQKIVFELKSNFSKHDT